VAILLQSAGTETKQKKVQGPMPKYGETAETNDTFKPKLNGGKII
jgi:hypothetical protein